MIDLHGISREAFNLIVDEEVSGKEVYERKYRHPEKPGGQSGVTVGIGYDCGYSSAATIRNDWEGKIPHAMVEALASCAGYKGDAAFAQCARVKGLVNIPWEAAIDVFSNTSIPKYLKPTKANLPNFDDLHPHCQGVLLSLVYNRGASFQTAGDRYREMREIRAAMLAHKPEKIPALLRSMKRLWTTKSVRGVALRREHEAALFERGLREMGKPAHFVEEQIEPVAQDEDPTQIYDQGQPPEENAAPLLPPEEVSNPVDSNKPLNVQPEQAKYNLDVEITQRKLIKIGYYEVGDPNGVWGGKTKGALTAFLNDRGLNNIVVNGGLTPEINKAISDALAEGWTRPISEKRATATEKDLAPKIEAVKKTIWQRLVAKVAALGAGGSAIVSGISDQFSGLNEKLYPVKQFFVETPGWVWFTIVAMGAAIIWLSANRVSDSLKRDYNSGKIN